MKFRPLAALLVLVCCALMSCKTIEPANSMLKDLQEAATPEPLDSLSPPHEQRRAKAAMVRWVERYLKHEYRVVDQRFVLAASGDTNFAWMGSKAHHYVTQTLGGAMQTDGWFDDDNYMMFLWRFGDGSPRYAAFAITNDFLPGTRERALVGYFELVPSAKH
ncbi:MULTISPECIES: hypothetical protein [unclassified Lysobacter]|uniref:hypothetical protein n=1 Tax=unclassified Lysobacter TaxID=2635362 RepID=UPI001BEB5575|nr:MULTISPECIES: hypothetical protein [unclassified Lysobacter]MBT2748096.1 hypothetical protein [Lysobacter sp. ISL-42]MBT2754136.1 hypothetical protein [Lysobacter sp. ISL-50]MBT2776038.1 hypothetical protein [Lysobacter sp. ISL-54]MBT2784123.1 hypothetical protein [Lysobacter sp. ISL-52]